MKITIQHTCPKCGLMRPSTEFLIRGWEWICYQCWYNQSAIEQSRMIRKRREKENKKKK